MDFYNHRLPEPFYGICDNYNQAGKQYDFHYAAFHFKQGNAPVENCNFLKSKVGANVNFVDCYIDENRMNGTEWVVTDAMTEDGDYYVLPTLSFQIAGGVHTIRLYYGADNGGFSSETVNIRIVNGMTTHFSIGEQAGNLAVSVSFDIQDAIVN